MGPTPAPKDMLTAANGNDGWRVGHAVWNAMELDQEITDRECELLALAPEPIELALNAPKWYHDILNFRDKVRSSIWCLRWQAATWEDQVWKLKDRFQRKARTIWTLTYQVHTLSKRALDHTPENERLPLAKKLQKNRGRNPHLSPRIMSASGNEGRIED